ncbi:MAG: replication factor C small subunit, partial [Nanoarchaeota archaeon]
MENSYLWTERYRPKKFEEVIGHHDIVKRLKALVEQKNIPHLLFSGPAGVGKTTLALVIARELYGDDWKQNFLELNASNDRGIDIIRNEVKDFAKTKGIANIPFKLILLDECDALTKEAQQALRRTMETYSNSCRFILSCNFVNKVIDPIKSRCAIFKFKPLNKKDLKEIVSNISSKENLNIDEETINDLF